MRKYLLYATGEILLVVLGILIALQVNDWNEERKLNKQEQYLLTELKEEFVLNLNRLQNDLTENGNSIRDIGLFIETLQEKDPSDIDPVEIDAHVINLMNYYSEFDPVSGVIDDALSTGKLEVLSNDSLRYLISQWSGQLIDLKQDYDFRNEYFIPQVIPGLTERLPVINSLLRSTYVNETIRYRESIDPTNEWDYGSLAGDQELIGILAIHALNQEYVISAVIKLTDYVNNVLQVIEEEQKRYSPD